MQYLSRSCVLLAWLCGGWLYSQPAASEAQVYNPSGGGSRGAFTLGRMSGVFTVADFRSVNGVTQAAGWLTANVTDASGTKVGAFTNFPVRVPVSGILAENPIEADAISDPVILPQLGTNTCTLLGVVIGAIDITVPGLGLNLHVNELSIVVRGDRDTTVGDLLCTLLGDNLLAFSPMPDGTSTRTISMESSLTKASLNTNVVTLEQLRGLTGIVLGAPDVTALRTSGVTLASTESSANTSSQTKTDPRLGLLQNLLQRAILTMQPTKAAAPAESRTSSNDPKATEPAQPAVPKAE
jgi:hypothetical protein